MKVVLLAGGFGTRLSEQTQLIPKPMVKIGERPILWHIMQRYAKSGFTNFCVALGYKAEVVKEYFLNYHHLNSDFEVSLATGQVVSYRSSSDDWHVKLIDTGLNTMTGGRLKRLKQYLDDEPFLLTYGDGVSDIDIATLANFHKNHGKMVTVTAVRPRARFGELTLVGDTVTDFEEKPEVLNGWVNGGYFICQPEFLNYMVDDQTVLEQEPLAQIAKLGELMAYKHDGFWQCMDTKRDHDYLEKLWSSGSAPWIGTDQK